MKKKTPRRSAAEWSALVEQQAQGNQTIGDFCACQQINKHSFVYWRQKLKDHLTVPPSGGFIAITAPAVKPADRIYVRTSNGVEVDLPGDYPITQLLQFLNASIC